MTLGGRGGAGGTEAQCYLPGTVVVLLVWSLQCLAQVRVFAENELGRSKEGRVLQVSYQKLQ